MTTFIIKYCQERDGTFADVTPDVARYFRVFRHTGDSEKWVRDFSTLSKANKFIRNIREAEKNIDNAFAAIAADRQDIRPESVEAVLEAIKQDITRRII
jgi:predicted nucleotide-binding protein (sugar kinase/HSP70/actin superfamily)